MRPRPRIFALLAFRDEIRHLPGYFANVSPHVDGIVALDDGSSDGSTEFVAKQPNVLKMLRRDGPPEDWDCTANRRRLVDAAWDFDPDWLVGIDADERVEIGFGDRARRIIPLAMRRGEFALALKLRELWGSPHTYRVDGIWGSKRVARLFKARRDHEWHDSRFHGHWAPLNSRVDGRVFPVVDLIIYHLRMIDGEDRAARRARYEALDPGGRYQAVGYAYLTDERKLRLRRVSKRRRYEPPPDPSG